MNIVIPKSNSASKASILELEKQFGKNLPKSYLAFIKKHGGARPEANTFKVGEDNSAGVDEFISANESVRVRDMVDGFPPHALPIASASGGNYVYLDSTSGSIYFWDHEIENGDIKLADSFDEFLEKLQPFDANEVQLKPGQVKRVWIDPEFLKEMKRNE